MKFVKKYKSHILVFFITAILFSSITAYAAILVAASDVSLSSTKTTTTNVQDSLDELYDKVVNGITVTPSEYFAYYCDYQLYTSSVPLTAPSDGFVVYRMSSFGTSSSQTTYFKVNGVNISSTYYGSPDATGTYDVKAGDVISFDHADGSDNANKGGGAGIAVFYAK